MAKNIYCCYTCYHLLIAIVKSIISTDDNSLILEISDDPSRGIFKDMKLFRRLEKAGVFSNIYYSEDVDLMENELVLSSMRNYLKLFIHTQKKKDEFRNILASCDNIFVFNDQDLLGRTINSLGKEYVLIEDGLDCFKLNKKIIHKKKNFKNFFKKIFYKNYQLGSSSLIRYVEVNDREGVELPHKKIIEVPRKALFSSLSKNDEKLILDIFDSNLDMVDFEGATLILTQPFFGSNRIGTEEEQIMLFEDLCKKYDGKIILKVHPRDKVNYDSIGGVTILTKMFPVELLDMMGDIKLRRAVTVSSTSIYALKCVEDKIILGWDWLDNWMYEHRNGII